MNENELKEKYPDFFKKGEVFAETNLVTLKKFESKKMLKTILPFEKLPAPGDLAAIESVIQLSSTAALRQCQRDIEENNIADSEGNIRAFNSGFCSRLLALLTQPN